MDPRIKSEGDIGGRPLLGKPLKPDHSFQVRPYVVGYRITTRVEVLAVLHGARDWPEKL